MRSQLRDGFGSLGKFFSWNCLSTGSIKFFEHHTQSLDNNRSIINAMLLIVNGQQNISLQREATRLARQQQNYDLLKMTKQDWLEQQGE